MIIEAVMNVSRKDETVQGILFHSDMGKKEKRQKMKILLSSFV